MLFGKGCDILCKTVSFRNYTKKAGGPAMANVHYPHLFTPITVRGKRIKNRIASAPPLRAQHVPLRRKRLFQFYRNGCAVFWCAGTRRRRHCKHRPPWGGPRYYLGNNAELFNFFSTHSIHEHTLPVMHLMTDMIHSYGALASIELNHGGMFCTPVTPGTPPSLAQRGYSKHPKRAAGRQSHGRAGHA